MVLGAQRDVTQCCIGRIDDLVRLLRVGRGADEIAGANGLFDEFREMLIDAISISGQPAKCLARRALWTDSFLGGIVKDARRTCPLCFVRCGPATDTEEPAAWRDPIR